MFYKEKHGSMPRCNEGGRINVMCISADFSREYLEEWNNSLAKGTCLFDGYFLQLVIRERRYQKPNYEYILNALCMLRNICMDEYIYEIALPKIGFEDNPKGYMRLNWIKIRKIIRDVFQNTDIDILVYLGGDDEEEETVHRIDCKITSGPNSDDYIATVFEY